MTRMVDIDTLTADELAHALDNARQREARIVEERKARLMAMLDRPTIAAYRDRTAVTEMSIEP